MQAMPLIIAHRGASGYLVEHTAEAYVMAHAMGADLIEMDVVLSRDGVPVIVHDLVLDAVTNVADVFPDRRREDGRFYVIDFDWSELQRLRKWERFDPLSRQAVYPKRFPAFSGDFQILSLAQAIELIQGMNSSSGRRTGICPEIKAPAFHLAAGLDLTKSAVEVLLRYGYLNGSEDCYIQCFDPQPLKQLREKYGDQVRLVQLIGENSWNEADVDYDQLRTAEGLRLIASYADAIGPHWPQLLRPLNNGKDSAQRVFLLEAARENGLKVFPFTMRAEDLPAGFSLDQLHRLFLVNQPVDGVFTDFPDLALKILSPTQ